MSGDLLAALALVFLGALAGAWAALVWCGCASRWRWRRAWRGVADRSAAPFFEQGHTTRFLARAAEERMAARARELQRKGAA